MTLAIQDVPQRISITPVPAWLGEVLQCSCCGEEDLEWDEKTVRCRVCLASSQVRDGVVGLIRPELADMVHAQRRAWLSFEQASRGLEPPSEELASLQADPPVGPSVRWLREMLQAREPCRVLEIGAGRGWAAAALAADGHEVLATDILDDERIGLGYAARLGASTGHPFGCAVTPAETLPVRSESFDVVYCTQTLRHIVDLERTLREASRVLRPGGWFAALSEPFRGLLTTPAQRLQNCPSYLLARSWHYFPPDASVPKVISRMRADLGTSLFEICRRAPHCLDVAQSNGFQAIILPTPLFLTLPQAIERTTPEFESLKTSWLTAIAEAYRLDSSRLQERVVARQESDGADLVSELAVHWILHGNWDGVILGRKNASLPVSWPQLDLRYGSRCRRLESLLLECSPRGMLPIYGLYGDEADDGGPYSWLMPEAAILVPRGRLLELKLACPPPPFRCEPMRIDVRIDDERAPRLVSLVFPGQTATLKMPLPAGLPEDRSVLVRLTANMGFLPSDTTGSGGDNRLLALRLREARTL